VDGDAVIGTDHGDIAFCGVNLVEGLDEAGALKRIIVDTGHTRRRPALEDELRRRRADRRSGRRQRRRRRGRRCLPGARDRAAATYTPSTAGIRDFLAEERRAAAGALRDRFARGKADGDVPPGADIGALAGYISSVQFGMSVQARDGATREELSAVVDCAMAALERLERPTA
jgi:hypothetical protein